MTWLAGLLFTAAFAATPWPSLNDRVIVTEIRADLIVPMPNVEAGFMMSPEASRNLEAAIEQAVRERLRISSEDGKRTALKFRVNLSTRQIKPRRTPTQNPAPVRLDAQADLHVFFYPSGLAAGPIPLEFYISGEHHDALVADLIKVDHGRIHDTAGAPLLDALLSRHCGPLLIK